jgi:TonB family protein
MKSCFRFWSVISFSGVSLSWPLRAQTTNEQKKNGVLPQVTDHPEPSPSRSPKKVSALAVFDIVVGEKGQVLDPKLLKTSGSDDLDHDARIAVRQWKFGPSTCDGTPTRVPIAVEIQSNVTHQFFCRMHRWLSAGETSAGEFLNRL